jgi:hypothetical protein
MVVRRLECPNCGVGVDGRFDGGPLARLNREQLAFVETFLRARGKIKDVEEELGISYPTVIKRLDLVNVLLGNQAAPSTPKGILEQLERGEISVQEATQLLKENQT